MINLRNENLGENVSENALLKRCLAIFRRLQCHGGISGRGTGRRGGGGGRGGTRQATKTPTAEELDAELEAYVKEVK